MSKIPFKDFVRKDRLLEILLFLNETAGFGASHHLLRTAIDRKGHSISSETILGDLTFLAEEGLSDLRQDGVSHIARLKSRGQDVCTGLAAHPSIKRPQPE